MKRLLAGIVLTALLVWATAAAGRPRPKPRPKPRPPAVLLAAGDVADCESTGDEATAVLLGRTKGTIATLGDNVYENGSAEEFANCYLPSWGRFKQRTRPAPGNHDYRTAGAAGYFDYFGTRAGPGRRGWYSYDLGAWHLVALNSNCSSAGGCEPGSPQQHWLDADLVAHSKKCTLAYWHHARFSSGSHGDDASVDGLFRTLYDRGADVVLVGHDHDYERFDPQDPDGAVDPARGLREFVVGTGGRNHTPLARPPSATSKVRNATTFGVLKLTLSPGRYSWSFLAADPTGFADGGSARCH